MKIYLLTLVACLSNFYGLSVAQPCPSKEDTVNLVSTFVMDVGTPFIIKNSYSLYIQDSYGHLLIDSLNYDVNEHKFVLLIDSLSIRGKKAFIAGRQYPSNVSGVYVNLHYKKKGKTWVMRMKRRKNKIIITK